MSMNLSQEEKSDPVEPMSLKQGKEALAAAELLYSKMEEQSDLVSETFGKTGWTDGDVQFNLRMYGSEHKLMSKLISYDSYKFPVKIDDVRYLIEGIRWNTDVKSYDVVLSRF